MSRAVRRMHAFTSPGMAVFTVLALVTGALVAVGVSGALSEGQPVPPAVITEDDPGWDCVRQGNRTCRIRGVLVTSIDDMPSDPFARCVFLMDIPGRIDPDGLTYADTVCEPIRGQLG